GGVLRQGRYGEFLLAVNTQARSASDQYFERWACFQCFGHHSRGREDLFEIIQKEQEWPRALQSIANKLWNGAVGYLLDIECSCESDWHQVGIRDRRQTN